MSVIDVLENGYKIPLIALSKAAKFPNNHSALNNGNFVTQAVEQHLNTGKIKEVKNPPSVVNPLSVSENGSQKFQLVLDLRYVNKHVFKDKIIVIKTIGKSSKIFLNSMTFCSNLT